MPQFTTTRRVRHSATDMFDLVADVEAYPRIRAALREPGRALARAKDGDREILVADMTDRLQVHPRDLHHQGASSTGRRLTIRAEYLDGPFSHLENAGASSRIGRGDCIVHFAIDYEFRSRDARRC